MEYSFKEIVIDNDKQIEIKFYNSNQELPIILYYPYNDEQPLSDILDSIEKVFCYKK